MSDNSDKKVTRRGNWGFSLFGIQLISQGVFTLSRNVVPYAEQVQMGLGVLAIAAGALILIGE